MRRDAIPIWLLIVAVAVAVFAFCWAVAAIHNHMTWPTVDADPGDDPTGVLNVRTLHPATVL
jgi:hypothetical protein